MRTKKWPGPVSRVLKSPVKMRLNILHKCGAVIAVNLSHNRWTNCYHARVYNGKKIIY